jgi:FixJ family two-component response regulator
MMPEMNGMQLHARLLEAAPWLAARTVFLTGGAFTPAASDFLEHVQHPRVDKPFEPQTLRDAVARVLGGRAAAPVAS